jgi:hypothetical protein
MAGPKPVVPESTIPGTQEWAETVVSNARLYAGFTEKDVRPLVDRYRALCEHRAWETWFADEPKTLARFCREVLGYEDEFLETMSAGVAVLDKEGYSGPVSVEAARNAVRLQAMARATRAKAMAAGDGVEVGDRGGDRRSSEFQSDNITLKSGRGTSESYLRRRLKRERRDLYERVLLPRSDVRHLSTYKAAIEAGISSPTFSVRAGDPQRAAKALRKRYQNEQLELLVEYLQEVENGSSPTRSLGTRDQDAVDGPPNYDDDLPS